MYGKGHVTTGLTTGRNGIVLWEREGIEATDVLVAEMPISGWTHLAIVYKGGAASLFVNGDLLKEGTASGKVVHPGLNYAFQRDGAMYYNGDMTEPQLLKEVIDPRRIQQLVRAGVPAPETRAVEVLNKRGLLFYKEGKFSLQESTGKATNISVTGLGNDIDLSQNWTVSFPSNLGAPATINLDKLMSLHKHPEAGVKFFSGTATYTKHFNLPTKNIARNKRLVLDLGRVEVLAEVKVNGKDLGTLWKPPFKIDITDFVKAGNNLVEIAVTNLWPNRLIGDEQMPDEAEYVSGVNAGPYSVLSNGAIKALPDWYAQGKPKSTGGRVTFTTWKHYHAHSPLLESGLLGPVSIHMAMILKYKV